MAHIPVLYKECIDGLRIKPDGIYLDMTLGGFGHGRGICEQLSSEGIYIGLDKDDEALSRAKALTGGLNNKIILRQCDFSDFSNVLSELGINNIDGCLMDLGVSSFQLDDAQRGFSFLHDGPLDMRMNRSASFTCENVVNEYSEKKLAEIIYKYSDEKFARQIAKAIIKARTVKPLKTTLELSEIIKNAIPLKYRFQGKNPATRTFQALRIEVNDELSKLFETISSVIERLSPGGRIAVISFHSLEDRIVKEVFREKAKGCICPKDIPVCVCGVKPSIKIMTNSPITPKEGEISRNARSRSAKLRIAEKLA